VIVTVLLFRGADLAGLDAGLDLGEWYLKVLARPADRQARRGGADLGAIQAGADAVPHVRDG
jgi:hypothetical protein